MKTFTKPHGFQKFVLWGALLVGLAAAGFAGPARPALAQTPPPPVGAAVSDDQVNAIARQLYCPVCENIPLDVCPTQACTQWRDLIRQKLAQGQSEAQIKDYFVAQYGDRVLSEPPRRGLNWLVYLLPVVFFAGGALLLWNVLRHMRRPATAAPPQEPLAAPPTADPFVDQLEEELRRRERGEQDG